MCRPFNRALWWGTYTPLTGIIFANDVASLRAARPGLRADSRCSMQLFGVASFFKRQDRGPNSDKSREKAIKSLEQRIDEHKQKLQAYKSNPDAFANKGILKNAPNAEVRQSIIDGRIKHLEHEIQTFQNQVDAVRH